MMSKDAFNCFKLHPKCKAWCCSDKNPIPGFIMARNRNRIVRPYNRIVDVLGDCYSYITDDGKCVFLNNDLTCNIYDDRPELCQKYGDETHPMMTCIYQAKCGRERSRQERRRVQREQDTWIEAFFKNLDKNKNGA